VKEPRKDAITLRSVLLGALTAGGLALFGNVSEVVWRVGSLVKEQYPLILILTLLVWVGINTLLTRLSPRARLSTTELMVILGMAWIAGMMPGVGWMGYLIGALPAPHFFATPENRWAETFMDALPAWAFPSPTPYVVDRFYFGLQPGESIPWSAWALPVGWWFSVSLAMTGAGLCVSVLFHRQWADAERLTYPLVGFAEDLAEVEPGRVVPKVFRSPVFWAGFAWTAGVIFWNVLTFFYPGVPRSELFDAYPKRAMTIVRDFPEVYYRVNPLVIGLGYLCNLDLLFSFWVFNALAVLQIGLIQRTGLVLGEAGQPSTGTELINLESHGAMTALVIWSVWAARRRLRDTWRQARSGGRGGEAMTCRAAWIGLGVCAAYVFGWLMAAGMGPGMAAGQMALMFVGYFAVMKYIAASGFGYLFPVGEKGGWFLKTVMGTAAMTAGNLTGLELVNSGAFYGAGRMQTLQTLPHHLKALENVREGRPWVAGTVWLAFAVGFLVSAAALIYSCYARSALYLRSWTLWEGPLGIFEDISRSVGEAQRTVFDAQKLSVWLAGAAGAGLLALLRTRLTWWPLHPLGLAFQYTSGPRYYAFSIFWVWLVKSLILRYGDIRLYHRAKPFFYGTVAGYAVGVAITMGIDLIWFPGEGHGFHNW
jgi:hypothetical protein